MPRDLYLIWCCRKAVRQFKAVLPFGNVLQMLEIIVVIQPL